VQEPEGKRMIAAPKYASLWKSHCRGNFVCRTRFPWREANVLGEETGKCTRETQRSMDPDTCAKVAEIMSGRAISQQGLATTCKDLTYKGKPRRWEGFGLAHESI
jgi:hypothetical protein